MTLTEKEKKKIEEEELYRQKVKRKKMNKNPALAAILSFIIPGLGQVYNNQIGKGFIFFFIAIGGMALFAVPTIIIWIIGIFDAYNTAKTKTEKQKSKHKTNHIPLLIFLLIIGILALSVIRASTR